MRQNKNFFLIFFLLFFLILTVQIGYVFSTDNSFLNKSTVQQMDQEFLTNEIITETYTNHPRIEISNESDFQTLGFTGDGSELNPYLIEGFNITVITYSSCIDIQNINAYVTIQNNYLDGCSEGSGIYTDNANVSVKNNIIVECEHGIFLSNTNGSEIVDNFINTSYMGIQVEGNENLIFKNTIELSSNTGIRITGDENNVEENRVYRAELGTCLQGDGNSFTKNLFFNCIEYGIQIFSPSANNLIKWNDFVWNKLYLDSQAYCQDETSSNIFTNNYWDDFTYPDTNSDGIVDNSYLIPCGMYGNTSDDFPLTTPYNTVTSSLHYFNRPRIISLPTSQIIYQEVNLSKVVRIEWCPVTDSMGHAITYSLFHSEGDNWAAISEDITENYVDWDTTNLVSGGAMCCCRLKVVAMCSDGLTAEYITGYKYGVVNDSATWNLPIFVITLSIIAIITRKKRH